MRRMNVPPWWRANAQANSAVRMLPRCRKPVGLGAKRVRIYGFHRRSSVVGVAGFGGSSCTVTGPGVWPCAQKRATRRASASFALTGNVS